MSQNNALTKVSIAIALITIISAPYVCSQAVKYLSQGHPINYTQGLLGCLPYLIISFAIRWQQDRLLYTSLKVFTVLTAITHSTYNQEIAPTDIIMSSIAAIACVLLLRYHIKNKANPRP